MINTICYVCGETRQVTHDGALYCPGCKGRWTVENAFLSRYILALEGYSLTLTKPLKADKVSFIKSHFPLLIWGGLYLLGRDLPFLSIYVFWVLSIAIVIYTNIQVHLALTNSKSSDRFTMFYVTFLDIGVFSLSLLWRPHIWEMHIYSPF